MCRLYLSTSGTPRARGAQNLEIRASERPERAQEGAKKQRSNAAISEKKSRCGTRLSMSRLAATTTAFRMRNVHHRYAIVATITLHVASIRPPFAHTNVAWPHTSRRTTCTLRFQSAVLWWAKNRFFTRFWTRPPMVQRGVWARSAK